MLREIVWVKVIRYVQEKDEKREKMDRPCGSLEVCEGVVSVGGDEEGALAHFACTRAGLADQASAPGAWGVAKSGTGGSVRV